MEPLRTTKQWTNNIAGNFCENPFAKYPFFQLLIIQPPILDTGATHCLLPLTWLTNEQSLSSKKIH